MRLNSHVPYKKIYTKLSIPFSCFIGPLLLRLDRSSGRPQAGSPQALIRVYGTL